MSIEFYSKPFIKSELPFYNGLLGGAGVNTRVAIKVQNPPKVTPMPMFQSKETPEKRAFSKRFWATLIKSCADLNRFNLIRNCHQNS